MTSSRLFPATVACSVSADEAVSIQNMPSAAGVTRVTQVRRICFAISVVLAVIVLLWILHDARDNVHLIMIDSRDTDVGNDYQPLGVCHYFPVDANNELALLFKKSVELDCPFSEPLTRIHPVTGKLVLNMSQVYRQDYTCSYQFFRRHEQDESYNDYDDWQKFPDEGSLQMTMEQNYVKVQCSNFWGLEVYANTHVFVPSYSSKHFASPSKPSVVVLMVESLTLHGFKRRMPLTHQQVNRMNGNVFEYFVKSHYNTFPNAFAFLTGLPINTTETGEIIQYEFNNIEFLWNVFKKEGYTTGFMEDLPTKMDGLFQFHGNGFQKQPTDFYPHAFWKEFYASWAFLNKVNRHMYFKRDFCDGRNGRKIDLFLEQIVRFVRQNRRHPFFLYSMAAQLTHEDVNSLSWLDQSFSQTLAKIHQMDNNTIIVLAGDHGFRLGYSAANSIGRLEERMSLMSVIIPDAVHAAYPHMRTMMTRNQNRLVSIHDFHLMMSNIATGDFRNPPAPELLPKFSGPIDPSRELVDEFRGCSDAGIEQQYCVCGRDVYFPLFGPRYDIYHHMLGITEDLDKIVELVKFYVSRKCDPSFVPVAGRYRLPGRNQSILNEHVIVRLVNDAGENMSLNLYRSWARGSPSDWLISRNAKCRP